MPSGEELLGPEGDLASPSEQVVLNFASSPLRPEQITNNNITQKHKHEISPMSWKGALDALMK